MNLMVASVLASVAGASAPLLMVECAPGARGMPRLAKQRRRLWAATLFAILVLLAWLYADRSAVAAGHRSLAVTAAAVVAFTTLFTAFAYPALRAVQAVRATAPQQLPSSVPVFRASTDVPVLFLFAAALVSALLSPNDIGYRLKGTGMLAAALALYFLGQPRALRTFLAFMGAAIITLYAQWENPFQRTIGVASQLTIGVVGFVWCAQILTRPGRAGRAR